MSVSILSSKKSEYISSSVQYPGTVKEKRALNVPLGEDVFAPARVDTKSVSLE